MGRAHTEEATTPSRQFVITETESVEATAVPSIEARGGQGIDPELRDLLARRPGIQQGVVAALRRLDGADDLDHSLWGTAPADAEVAAQAIGMEAAGFLLEEGVRRAAAPIEAVAAALDVGTEAVWRLIGSGQLLTIPHALVPTWQIEGARVVPGIAEVRAAYPGDAVSLSLWVLRPNELLGGTTPRSVLLSGSFERVVAAADALAG